MLMFEGLRHRFGAWEPSEMLRLGESFNLINISITSSPSSSSRGAARTRKRAGRMVSVPTQASPSRDFTSKENAAPAEKPLDETGAGGAVAGGEGSRGGYRVALGFEKAGSRYDGTKSRQSSRDGYF